MLHKIFVLSLLVLGLRADDFVCPKDKITITDGTTGAIPKGATSMVKFAKNTNCTFTFTVPKGFAIRMETTAYYEASPGDSVTFDYFYIPDNAVKNVQWAAGPELNVSFFSVTGNLTFFAQYSYVDLTGYTQVIKKTGNYFNATVEPNKYYTIEAADGDTVTWNVAMRNTGFYDHTINELMMFDGPDIVNSEYIGRITQYTSSFNFHSETKYLTFLNLYGSASDSFILPNDFSKIKPLSEYNVRIVDPVKETTGHMYNSFAEADSYYTLICDGCDHFYIEELNFSDTHNDSAAYLEVQGMSPSQGLPPILNYTSSPYTNSSLPQLIPSPMATFHVHNSIVEFFVKADLQSDYLAVKNEQKRCVYSPKLWNPNAEQKFDYTFSDATKVYNFSINLESVRLLEDGDELDVQVGSVDGLTTLDKKYTKTAMAKVPISGVGRYLHLKYSGSQNSEVILNFEEIDPTAPVNNPSSTAPTGTTQTPPSSTTMKSMPTSATGTSMSSTAPTNTPVSSTAPPSTSAPTSMSTSPQVSTITSTISSTPPTSVITTTGAATSTIPSTQPTSPTISTVTPTSLPTTARSSRLPSTITSSPVTDASRLSTSTFQTTTSGASALTGFLLLVLSSITLF